MMPPLASVATLVTYLEVLVELSQPQLPAVGRLAALLVWNDSVMEVLHAEAARITSDSLARLV